MHIPLSVYIPPKTSGSKTILHLVTNLKNIPYVLHFPNKQSEEIGVLKIVFYFLVTKYLAVSVYEQMTCYI